MSKDNPVYPTAPPPPTYEEAQQTYPAGAANPASHNVQHVTQVVVVHGVKCAPQFEPYSEFCPNCQKDVVTRVEYTMGFCSWLMLLLGIFVFCPLLCCFCCDFCKDARHYCPNCATYLSLKRR